MMEPRVCLVCTKLDCATTFTDFRFGKKNIPTPFDFFLRKSSYSFGLPFFCTRIKNRYWRYFAGYPRENCFSEENSGGQPQFLAEVLPIKCGISGITGDLKKITVILTKASTWVFSPTVPISVAAWRQFWVIIHLSFKMLSF